MIRICERCGKYEAAQDDEWCDHCILAVDVLREEEPIPDDPATEDLMRHYYTLDDLVTRVEEYEEEYGIPSEELLTMWQQGMKPDTLSHFDRHLWLSYLRELRELYPSGE